MDRTKLRECNRLMAGGSKSFFAASRVLPARVRGPATALYAFCRVADDAIDHSRTPWLALADLSRRLDDIYAGRPQAHLCDHALAHVVQSHHLPRLLPDALLEGFAWDAEGRRTSVTERGGFRKSTLYDALGNVLRVEGADGVVEEPPADFTAAWQIVTA